MASESSERSFKSNAEEISQLVSEEKYGEAFQKAMEGLRSSHKKENVLNVKKYLSLMRGIVTVIESQYSENKK
jgi:hypothetical protein